MNSHFVVRFVSLTLYVIIVPVCLLFICSELSGGPVEVRKGPGQRDAVKIS
jgi:hypothetical protein